MDWDIDYDMEALFPIVSELANTFAGCDSTSITYEKAQMLMAGVIYCLKEYKNFSEKGLINSRLTVKEQYSIGRKIVFEKAVEIKNIYNEISGYFDDYNVENLGNTMRREIPEFLTWYDAKYFPQETVLTLDYPLMKDIHLLSGVDAVYAYIHAIKAEQLFLKKFNRIYILNILEKAVLGYKDMIENVCEIVLLNTVGHVALGKPFDKMGFSTEEYQALERIFKDNSVKESEAILNSILQTIVEQAYEDNQEMLSYFQSAVKNMAVRINAAAQINQLEKIFLL